MTSDRVLTLSVAVFGWCNFHPGLTLFIMDGAILIMDGAIFIMDDTVFTMNDTMNDTKSQKFLRVCCGGGVHHAIIE